MKTANLTNNSCPNIRHLSLFTFLTLTSVAAFGLEINNKIVTKRAPASAFEEEVLVAPYEQKASIKYIFAEDDAGVMRGMRDSLSSWDQTEEFKKTWHLESTSLYATPTTSEKSKYISSSILKYADKRLAGEMKNAEEGSTLYSVGKVEKSLRPNASVGVSKNISIKFKARVLQGKAIMDVKNPWVECSATVKANGKTNILTKKDFKELGTSTGVEYSVNESQWVAFVDQEITQNVKARVSSTTQPNGNDADKRVEMNASFPFNL